MHYYTSQPPESRESLKVWSKTLEQEEPSNEHIQKALLLGRVASPHAVLHCAMLFCVGVPPSRREEVWGYLSNQFRARRRPDWEVPAMLSEKEDFQQLSQESTEYEHNITVDLSKFSISQYCTALYPPSHF